MSFAAPFALLLLVPFTALFALRRSPRFNTAAQLPGAWARVVAPEFRRAVTSQSDGRPFSELLTFLAGVLLIVALGRPGVDLKDADDYASLGGRVIVIDVGADLARHRQFVSALREADPTTATAIVAVAGDAYRITPFTSDRTHIDRYVRVLNADMMPRPGQKPHLGLALAERLLEQGGYLVKQVIFLSARAAPEAPVGVPAVRTGRIVVDLGDGDTWRDWAAAQEADLAGRGAIGGIVEDFSAVTRAAARTELPDAAMDLKAPLIGLAAILFVFTFRRRSE